MYHFRLEWPFRNKNNNLPIIFFSFEVPEPIISVWWVQAYGLYVISRGAGAYVSLPYFLHLYLLLLFHCMMSMNEPNIMLSTDHTTEKLAEEER